MNNYTEKNLIKIARDLFPINRSITGKGVDHTLAYIKKILPKLKINKIPSNTKVFDWTVPKEWNVKEAYIKDMKGNEIVNFKKNNLHVMGYSAPIKKILPLEELIPHLYSIKKQPKAIPFVTSYYKKNWGFCISENEKKKLKKGKYQVYIDSELKNGYLKYGELLIKGKSNKEILFSSNICHPSMANNELSGLIVLISTILELLKLKKTRLSYRFLFLPETIGSIAYLSKNYKYLQKNILAGYVLSCIGDKGKFSFIPTRYENTLSDKVALFCLKKYRKNFNHYTYLDRGSDERQFNSPGIDLPISSILRSKYGSYPEYHTSLDNLSIINNKTLNESSEFIFKIISILEINQIYGNNKLCEPFLTKYNLYPTISSKNHLFKNTQLILDILSYCDGKNDLIDISNILNKDILEINKIILNLIAVKLIKLK